MTNIFSLSNQGLGESKTGSELVKTTKINNEECACQITISCSHPSDDGSLQVEMSYEGDPVLASYLLENAQCLLEEDPDLLSA